MRTLITARWMIGLMMLAVALATYVPGVYHDI
jgi:hypothetical protein